jgi:hypothetical protein
MRADQLNNHQSSDQSPIGSVDGGWSTDQSLIKWSITDQIVSRRSDQLTKRWSSDRSLLNSVNACWSCDQSPIKRSITDQWCRRALINWSINDQVINHWWIVWVHADQLINHCPTDQSLINSVNACWSSDQSLIDSVKVRKSTDQSPIKRSIADQYCQGALANWLIADQFINLCSIVSIRACQLISHRANDQSQTNGVKARWSTDESLIKWSITDG